MWQKAAGGILLKVRLLPDERLAVENPSMETGQISNKLELPSNTLSFVLYVQYAQLPNGQTHIARRGDIIDIV